MPLFKKVPGQAATQALSDKSKGSAMVELGKMLAASECLPGQVVVKFADCGSPVCGEPVPVRFPEPYDVSRLYSVPPRGACKPGELGWTLIELEPGKILDEDEFDALYSVTTCADQSSRRWRFSITSLGFAYATGLCNNNLDGKLDIGDGTSANVTQSNYCDIYKWLTKIDPSTNQPSSGPYYSSKIIQLHEGLHLDFAVFDFKFNEFGRFLDGIGRLDEPVADCRETAEEILLRSKTKVRNTFNSLMLGWKPAQEEESVEERTVQKGIRQYYVALAKKILELAKQRGWIKTNPCK
jgi:hypothetical protein